MGIRRVLAETAERSGFGVTGGALLANLVYIVNEVCSLPLLALRCLIQ